MKMWTVIHKNEFYARHQKAIGLNSCQTSSLSIPLIESDRASYLSEWKWIFAMIGYDRWAVYRETC